MYKKKLIVLAILTITLLYIFTVSAYAYSLDNGSVHGLPEKLVVLDDSGRSVSADGSYYFSVNDMKPEVTYEKNIQIMNLRDDESYNIYFSAESVSSTGNIDLENECECVITLDDTEIYRGKVTGQGTPDMQKEPLDLGNYAPNEYRYMKVSVKWNGTSAGGFVDNGERIVTASGTEIVREKTGETYISGETEFKWIFSAEVEKDDESSESVVESSSTTTSSETSSKGTSSKEASSKGTSSKEASSKGTSSKEASSKGTSSKEASSKGTSSKGTSSKGTSSKEASSKGTISKEASSMGSSSINSYVSSEESVSSGISSIPEGVSSMLGSNVSKTTPSSKTTTTTVSEGKIISSNVSSAVTLESFVQTGETVAIIAIICILTASIVLMILTAKRKQDDE